MDIMTYMFDEENNKRLFGLEQRRLGVVSKKVRKNWKSSSSKRSSFWPQ